MFDGGSELESLRSKEKISEADQYFLEEAKDADWCRPNLELRVKSGTVMTNTRISNPARESVYAKPINSFEVGKFPPYRRIGTLRQGEEVIRHDDHLDSVQWQRLFCADVRSLVSEVLTHICG